MKDIQCFSYNGGAIQLVGIVDDYSSFTFERSYSGIGEWQVVISGYSHNADYFTRADFIKAGEGVAGLITKRTITHNETEYTITINGVELKGLAQKRIMTPAGGQADLHDRASPEAVIEGIITTQLLAPSNAKRKIAGAIVRDGIEGAKITYDGRFQNAAEEITGLCEAYQIGWYADIENGTIKWYVYHGVDRSASQSTNNRFIISFDYDTLVGGNYACSLYAVNTALVAGQGSGVERAIVMLGDENSALGRAEVYVDARDLEDASLLPQRGKEKLAEYGSENVFEITPAQNTPYRVEYDLGDIGTFKEQNIDFRLCSITEVYENDNFTLDFVFGYDANTLAGAMKRITSNTDALLRGE